MSNYSNLEIVNLYDGRCGITGKRIPIMKPSVCLFDNFYSTKEGIRKVIDSFETEEEYMPIQNFRFLTFVPNNKGKKCPNCLMDSTYSIKLSGNTNNIIEICKGCFYRRLEKAWENINGVIKDTFYYDRSGFIVWKNTDKEIFDVISGKEEKADYIITIGFDDCGGVKKSTKLSNIKRLENTLRDLLETTERTSYGPCDICCEEKVISSIQVGENHFSIRICLECCRNLSSNLREFRNKEEEFIIANTI